MSDATDDERDRPRSRPAPADVRTPRQAVSRWRLLWVWLRLGSQSFGGGTATLFMIRRAAVEQERWLSDEEFTRDWSLCFIAPGINLLAMTVLVGHRVAGRAGALIALAGLLLPSVAITAVMAALYGRLQTIGAVQAAVEGIIPATVGLGLLLGARMVAAPLAASRREGYASLATSLLVLGGSMGAAVLWQPPVALVLATAGALSALAAWWRAVRQEGRP